MLFERKLRLETASNAVSSNITSAMWRDGDRVWKETASAPSGTASDPTNVFFT